MLMMFGAIFPAVASCGVLATSRSFTLSCVCQLVLWHFMCHDVSCSVFDHQIMLKGFNFIGGIPEHIVNRAHLEVGALPGRCGQQQCCCKHGSCLHTH